MVCWAMLELQGETPALMAASEELDRRLPAPEGLLARIDDGVVLFQLWESSAARQRNAEDPAQAEAPGRRPDEGCARGHVRRGARGASR